jgi:c-di-GMP-binding flagellar brake protein YcgR
MTQERRAFVRLTSKLTATYRLADPAKNLLDETVPSLTKDVSAGGVRLATAIQFPAGTQIAVKVKFPDRAAPVEFMAEVVWSQLAVQNEAADRTRRYDTGMRFLKISPEDQKFVLQHAALNRRP